MVRSRAVRENSQPLVMEDYDRLISSPHDPTGTVQAATTRTVLPDVHAQEQELGSYKPRRARSRKTSLRNVDQRRGAPSVGLSLEVIVEWRQWVTQQHVVKGSRT